jgi:polyamine oxidase
VQNYNSTFYQYSDENNYVFDSRGFNTFITGEASTFLTANDPRLLLNTIVKNITYSPTGPGVTVYNTDGSCISADFAIMTFSVGVLQSDLITFSPSLPDWKVDGISSMQMGTYTKIFLQFDPKDQFWDADTQFFLYADPIERGYFPVWQSLSHPDFLPNSGIFFVTVVDEQSYRVEAQSEAETLAQVLEVLQKMYPKIKIPKPIAFMYPRWSREPWALGSYSNWPTGTSLAMHENLRANLGGLYFAGEAASPEYYGFLQGMLLLHPLPVSHSPSPSLLLRLAFHLSPFSPIPIPNIMHEN